MVASLHLLCMSFSFSKDLVSFIYLLKQPTSISSTCRIDLMYEHSKTQQATFSCASWSQDWVEAQISSNTGMKYNCGMMHTVYHLLIHQFLVKEHNNNSNMISQEKISTSFQFEARNTGQVRELRKVMWLD